MMNKALLIILLLVSTCTQAQKTNKVYSKDTAKQSGTDTSKHSFVLVMPKENWEALLKVIQTADEKPSIIKAWTEFILNNVRRIDEPKKINK